MKISIIVILMYLFFQLGFSTNNNISLSSEKNWTSYPALFVENKGQLCDANGKLIPFVFFKMEAPGLDFYITETGATYVFKQKRKENEEEEALRKGSFLELEETEEESIIDWDKTELLLVGASIKKENIIKEKPSNQGYLNFFYPHCKEGIYGVREYQKIIIKDVYPGIDWVFYGSDRGGYKYDFVVHAGANPHEIELVYRSTEKLVLNTNGDIQITMPNGKLKESAPVCYLENEEIESHFKISQIIKNEQGYFDNHIKFDIDKIALFAIEHSIVNTLIIDPQIEWSTFYGGNLADGPMCVATDADNNVIIAGYTGSFNFPTLNAFQGTSAGGSGLVVDAMLMKFNNDGQRLWATYYGGTGADMFKYVAVDKNNNIFVGGYSGSADFPVQNAFQSALAGDGDGIIAKFDENGIRKWATFFGGTMDDGLYALQIDGNSDIIVGGSTQSSDFPLQNSFQPTKDLMGDGVIAKLDNNGNLLWSSYYGGNAFDELYSIAIDDEDNIYSVMRTYSTNLTLINAMQANYIGNGDIFISKMDKNGKLIWSTYYGGTATDIPCSIAFNNNEIFIVGETESKDFPTKDAFQDTAALTSWDADAFIVSINSDGDEILWSTYFGGNGWDYVFSDFDHIDFDHNDNLYFCFSTLSTDLYTKNFCGDGYYKDSIDGFSDQFILKFDKFHQLVGATYFGGGKMGYDHRASISIDNQNNMFLSGEWVTDILDSYTYPLVEPLGSTSYYSGLSSGGEDGFITKFLPPPSINLNININSGIEEDTCDIICKAYAAIEVIPTDSNLSFIWSNNQNKSTITNLCKGSYFVSVSKGCIDTLLFIDIMEDTKTCTSINNTSFFFIPNVFSPNNDNVNDAISFSLLGNVSFTVCDRFGKLVYKSEDADIYWNGKDINGKILPEGIYIYFMDVYINENGIAHYSGNIQLLN